MAMQKIGVAFSSNVKEIGHDPALDLGYVRFGSGDYNIIGLDAETFADWQKAKSKGGFYNLYIRDNPKFTVERIKHDEDDHA